MKISVIGAGSWGTALASILSKKNQIRNGGGVLYEENIGLRHFCSGKNITIYISWPLIP